MGKINLAITGCMGRMGQQLIKSAIKDRSTKLVALTENRFISKKINGIYQAVAGDCYIQAVEWGPNGELNAWSVHQFGSATFDKESVHYDDQSILFQKENSFNALMKSNLNNELIISNKKFDWHQDQSIEKVENHMLQNGLNDYPTSIFVSNDNWHLGVLGIVASRLKEKFHRPSFVISSKDDISTASARSLPGIDIGKIIIEGVNDGILLSGGGHAMAGGFSLEKDKIEEFNMFGLFLGRKTFA